MLSDLLQQEKMTSKKKSDYEEIYFFVKIILVYISWKLIHAYLCRSNESMNAWQLALVGYEHVYASISCFLLRILGYPAYSTGMYIFIDQTHMTFVAEHCLAIPAMFVFTFSILLFPGKWKDKAWFIPLGLLFIFCLNLFRIFSLCAIMVHVDEITFQVYHRFVFLGITYASILAMLFWWMNKAIKD